ncbi:MAG: YiiX/YebB-like N1pC/P60 family cysteine hydrolase [Alterinioella nitratireducens]|uniref:YiiX/YebB-like N1pC/P60 family cysteine hydrolase n=1 Tax=Alterinioella nitratireducens TaxID=2735915 RepID=UPI004059A6A2
MTQSSPPESGSLLQRIGAAIAEKLTRQSRGYEPYTPSDQETLLATLKPGDILLVEGNARISGAIKYLTQSTWSHAAIYVGDALPAPRDGADRPRLIEVNVADGCVAVPLSKYACFNTRICRPVGLTESECRQVTDFMIDKLGLRYDLRNIVDLMRYFLPTPPVPVRWRRRMIALGSGDPTRAICSSLIAQAFQSITYPILPDVVRREGISDYAEREIYHIRHHSLFAPRDFDLSPYFQIIKPTLTQEFDFRAFPWGEAEDKEVVVAAEAS